MAHTPAALLPWIGYQKQIPLMQLPNEHVAASAQGVKHPVFESGAHCANPSAVQSTEVTLPALQNTTDVPSHLLLNACGSHSLPIPQNAIASRVWQLCPSPKQEQGISSLLPF